MIMINGFNLLIIGRQDSNLYHVDYDPSKLPLLHSRDIII